MKRPAIIISAISVVVAFSACSQPESPSPVPVQTISNHDTVAIEWESDMASALERARSEGKPVLINFFADWCVWCKRLQSTTLSDAKVASVLQNEVVPLSLDVDGAGKELSNEYRVDGLPTILVVDVSGQEIGRIPGYVPPDTFLEQIESFLPQS